MLEVRFYDKIEDSQLDFAVIIARTGKKWVFCKHKERDTYEVPGGHREAGETIEEAANRELKEETGLDLLDVNNDYTIEKTYLSPGMTDESIALVFCTCDGELNKDGLEDDEDIEAILVSKEEARKILKSKEFTMAINNMSYKPNILYKLAYLSKNYRIVKIIEFVFRLLGRNSIDEE